MFEEEVEGVVVGVVIVVALISSLDDIEDTWVKGRHLRSFTYNCTP